jgi:signal peptidase I
MSSQAPNDRVISGSQMIRRAVFGRSVGRTLARCALLTLAAYVTFGFLLIPTRGEGVSMRPTLAHGQFALMNRLAYWRTPPARGDIVALRLAGPSVVYIKRIIGMPGERVAIRAGTVLIDGRELAEPYVVFKRGWEVPETVLREREYLVIGDNRDMLARQHDFGKARRDRIIGRVVIW